MTKNLTRREFLAAAGVVAAGAACSSGRLHHTPDWMKARTSTTILFQGDSITDSGRNRTIAAANSGSALGTGYPLLIASAVLETNAGRSLSFYNRGVGGDRVPDLAARWQTDTIALAPDVLSVLVGVNDYWHKRARGYTGTVADYENGYVALLEGTRRALANVRLIVIEPFVLRVGAVDASWFPEFDQRRAAAERVARRVGATFVPLQSHFDKLASKTSPAYWAADGVHPTPAGHEVIAERWRAAMGL
jgi:lysophospholipase L1-like esterase